MEMPFPTNEHRRLEKLAGRFAAKEIVHPSNWSPEPTFAQSTTEGRVALDGFVVIQDYEQRQADGDVYRGHGVFRYDSASDTYELHWFDSTGEPLNLFRGGFEGQVMTLTSRGGDGWLRLIYDFNLDKGYRFRMETSADGDTWAPITEGDNLMARSDAGRTAARKTVTKTAGKKTTRKAAARKSGTKAPRKKAAASKGKKTVAKKAAARKVAAKKATARKTTARKAAAKKAAPKKSASKKSASKKSASKKAASKKAATKKAAPRATARNAVPASEKRRRQQSTAAHERAPARKTTRPAGASAGDGGGVSQQRSKGTAHKGPRMPRTHKTSTRVGWHKTAAKGTRTR